MVGISNNLKDLKTMLGKKIGNNIDIDTLPVYENCDIERRECDTGEDYDSEEDYDCESYHTPFYVDALKTSEHIKSYDLSSQHLFNLTNDHDIKVSTKLDIPGPGILSLFSSEELAIDITEIINSLKAF
jgi:hypothetical protein